MTITVAESVYATMVGFLDRLDEHRLPYTLAHVRPEALMVRFALPGERWEVEFLADGAVEVERFRSDGAIADGTALDALWERLAADEDRLTRPAASPPLPRRPLARVGQGRAWRRPGGG